MNPLPNESPEQILGVTYDELQAILAEIDNKKVAVSETNGALRSLIKEKLKEFRWNKRGLAVIRELKDMSSTQRADVLRTLMPMLNLMLDKSWRAEMADMAGDREADDDEE